MRPRHRSEFAIPGVRLPLEPISGGLIPGEMSLMGTLEYLQLCVAKLQVV